MRQPLQIIGPRSELSTRARGRMLLVWGGPDHLRVELGAMRTARAAARCPCRRP